MISFDQLPVYGYLWHNGATSSLVPNSPDHFCLMFHLEGQHNHRKPLRILRDRTHLLTGDNIYLSCNLNTFVFLMSYIFNFYINIYYIQDKH